MTAAARDKRNAVAVLFALLIVFYVVSIATEYVQAGDHGYGTGFSNQAHVPATVVRQVNLEDHTHFPLTVSARTISDGTLGNHGSGIWHDTWRWLLTIIAIGLILWFWYFIISRLGTL